MNTQNIIQEGFFDDLLRAIIPQSIQDRIDAELNDLSNIPEEDDDDRDAIDYM